jgi:two-component system chemotaxis sensor kinase CheA
MDEMQRFKETYITECFELLEDMESKLFGLDENNPDMEDLNAIFRCAHSIKGGSGAFGFDKIKNFTHILEGLLDGMREGKIPPTREAIDALLASVDIVRQMVSAAQANTEVAEGFGAEVAVQLNGIAGNTSAAPTQAAAAIEEDNEISIYDIDFKPHKGLFLSGNEPLLIINELKKLGSIIISVDASAIPNLDKIDPESCYTTWNFTLESEKQIASVKEVFEFVEDDCDLKIEKIAGFTAPAKTPATPVPVAAPVVEKQVEKPAAAKENTNEDAAKGTQAVTSIRIDVHKVDRLVNMVGEIVITQAMIGAQAGKLQFEDYPELMQGLQILSQHTIELQEAVMSVRMQPVKSVFSRMPRIVRDLSNQLKKDIRLETYGENTEIDKTVIEQLSDPLMHMIRNSVDHGIDDPESRIARGKPAQGVIVLSAEHTGGKIVIKISDDGRGVNREKVLSKAKEKGLVKPDETPSDAEIDNIIFMAGFSTADVVSDISGRGVGMDVVKRNIEGLGGTVSVHSKTGEGTTFTVTLPLTLAILDGMIVRVGQEKYIVPISNIIETLKPRKEDIRQIAGANDLVNVRGDFVPLVYLHRAFNIKNAEADATNALIVLVEAGTERFGLVVDELIGQQQVVIKSLEENSQAIAGISAATILGDGNVSLILDVAQLHSLSIRIEQQKHLVEAQ